MKLTFIISNRNGVQWCGTPDDLGDFWAFGSVYLTVLCQGRAIDTATIDGNNRSIREAMRDFGAMYK